MKQRPQCVSDTFGRRRISVRSILICIFFVGSAAATFELSLKVVQMEKMALRAVAGPASDCGKGAAARNACRIDCPQQEHTLRKHPLKMLVFATSTDNMHLSCLLCRWKCLRNCKQYELTKL